MSCLRVNDIDWAYGDGIHPVFVNLQHAIARMHASVDSAAGLDNVGEEIVESR